MAAKISDLGGIIRPTATDVFEMESTVEGSVKTDYASLLTGPYLAEISQLLGFTSANVVEVEATTKAMRVVLRPADIPQDFAYTVSHHQLGTQMQFGATTAAITDQDALFGYWGVSGLAMLNKCTVAMCTSVISGTRTGSAHMSLRPIRPQTMWGQTTGVGNWILPPVGSITPPGFLNSSDYNSLRANQPYPSMQIVTCGVSNSITHGGIESSKALGDVTGGSTTTAGVQDIPPTLIFDAFGTGLYEPYIMVPGTGFDIAFWVPAAVTNQTVSMSATLQWDEWLPITPDRT